MQETLNAKIKFRESFRPFAPCVLAEYAAEWFELAPTSESPYMLLVAPVHNVRRTPRSSEESQQSQCDGDLKRRLSVVRSEIPAVTHVDDSARVQTVDSMRNPRLHSLLEAFHRRTGCPVLINTSFNVRGEPIVCSPADALRCFQATEMDVLVLEDVVVYKFQQSPVDATELQESHLAQFQLD